MPASENLPLGDITCRSVMPFEQREYGHRNFELGPYSNARKKAEVPDPGSKLISYNFVSAAACEATQSF
jgi:hypothetical protein